MAAARTATAQDMASLRAGPADRWAHACRVGLHEAGHALAEILAGRALSRVELFVAGDRLGGWGSLQVTGGECEAHPGGPSSPAVLVAGVVAERMAGFPRRDGLELTSDYIRAEQQDPGFDRLRAQDDARHQLQQHWQAVAALAAKLLERGALGPEAEHIVRRHLPASLRDTLRLWGPPPEPIRRPRWTSPADFAAEQVDDRDDDGDGEYPGESVEDLRCRALALGEDIDARYAGALREGRRFSASEQATLAAKTAELERLVGLVEAFEGDEEVSGRR